MKSNSRATGIPGYLYALDGLRAMSLIFIVMFHTWQQSWIYCRYQIPGTTHNLFNFEIIQRYGYIAIDSFFVLSGFCLFYPIARDMFGESKFGGWKNFFIKRARRIYPSYIIALAAVILIPKLSYVVYYDPKNIAHVAKQVITHLLFIHTWDPTTLWTMLPTAWTMGIECQFYILFPLICIPFRKKPVLTFVSMAIIGAAIRLGLLCYADTTSSVVQAITPAYLDVFGAGMLCAYFVVYARNKSKNIHKLKPFMTLISAVCIFLIICFMYWLGKAAFPDGFSSDVCFRFLYRNILAALIAGFIFTACFSYDFWEKKIWGNKVFAFLSSISYTVFLWHQNIYIFLKGTNLMKAATERPMDDRPAMWRMIFICLISSVIIGWFVTRYIEAPISKHGYKGCFDKILRTIKLKKNSSPSQAGASPKK